MTRLGLLNFLRNVLLSLLLLVQLCSCFPVSRNPEGSFSNGSAQTTDKSGGSSQGIGTVAQGTAEPFEGGDPTKVSFSCQQLDAIDQRMAVYIYATEGNDPASPIFKALVQFWMVSNGNWVNDRRTLPFEVTKKTSEQYVEFETTDFHLGITLESAGSGVRHGARLISLIDDANIDKMLSCEAR